jgi:hypothetical protein
MSRINLNIEKLVLRGFEVADRTALVEGLRQELRRVLASPDDRGALIHSHRMPVLKLGLIPFSPEPSGARSFGCRVAQAVGKGLPR